MIMVPGLMAWQPHASQNNTTKFAMSSIVLGLRRAPIMFAWAKQARAEKAQKPFELYRVSLESRNSGPI
jgi:hypothetical protein